MSYAVLLLFFVPLIEAEKICHLFDGFDALITAFFYSAPNKPFHLILKEQNVPSLQFSVVSYVEENIVCQHPATCNTAHYITLTASTCPFAVVHWSH